MGVSASTIRVDGQPTRLVIEPRHRPTHGDFIGWRGEDLTIVWFVVWLVADLVGDREPLHFSPVNWWTGSLLLVVALDLNRQQPSARRK